MFHWIFPTFLVFTYVILCSCNEQFVVVAPNLIRTDSEENIYLQASGVSQTIPVTITITDFNTGLTLTEHYATLNAENKYHTLAPVQLPSADLGRAERVKKWVFLEVKFGGQHYEKRAVLVSFQAGYIFIQTNKPIYKPEEPVQMRAYVSSTAFKASDENPITIDVKNPGGDVVHQINNVKPNHGVFAAVYTLPKIVTEGKWTIIARFDHWPQNNFNTTFEVKKYVLPAFNVTVMPRKPFMDVDDTQLFVDITARYLFGETVFGTAYVVYGLKDGKKIRRAPKVKEVPMLGNGGTLNLTMDELKQACEVQTTSNKPDCTVESLVGSYVYIKLTVLTESGGDLVEAEKSTIKIVDVTYHDGTPANNIPLIIKVQDSSQTSKSGTVSINLLNQARPQTIIVTTNQTDLSEDRQARKEVIVEPYTPANTYEPHYLYIHESRHTVNLREMSIKMSIYSNRKSSIQEMTYLVLSKGKIMDAKRVSVNEQQVTSVTISVTQDMMPTFRFVAFYQIGGEVVSDSVKLAVSSTCVQPPVVSVSNTEFSPGRKLKLKIQGEPSAKISLVAVDQAVYLLSKNRFNQRHILNEVDSRDFGCTQGSGKNSMGVFSDAGLLFAMKNGPATDTRQEVKCPDNVRRRRSAGLTQENQAQLLGQFQEKLLQRCCRDGLRGVLMPYSCEQRALYITEGPECVKTFLKCCIIYKNKVNTQRPDDEDLGRNTGSGFSSDISNPDDNDVLLELGDDEEDFDIDKIYLRRHTQDSWLWRDVELPAQAGRDGQATFAVEPAIPDSITQWSILPVSSSTKTGFCVGEPWTFIVRRRFFVDLKLPYSVARNEQVEIKAVVYNYDPDETLNVRVSLEKTNKMCSVAFKRRHIQNVKVFPGSSTVVRYTIVPFEAGQIPIQVSASVVNLYNDRVEKILNAVVIHAIKPVLKGVVPKSEPVTKIKISGNILTETIENAIHDDPLAKLIRMPGGCVEQNLASMTFPIIASLYLQRTNGWETVGVQRKIEADQYIKAGYLNQLSFRNRDGSYPPYRKIDPSTWVTAYMVKVFTKAYSMYPTHQNIINIDHICRPVSFLLINTQLQDGHFSEASPVYNRYLTGGVRGSDSTATLTAFVSIALAEVKEANIDCNYFGADTQSAIDMAVPYLKVQLQRSPSSYTTAMISYALALLTDGRYDPTNTLLAASSGNTFWPDDDTLISLEATGYALLALVKMRRLTEAEKPLTYLKDRRDHRGAFGNTQTTMVVLQALSEYLIAQPPPVQTNLDVNLRIATRKVPPLNFNSKTSYQIRSFNVGKNEDLEVEAQGDGEGTVEVVTFYNQLPEEDVKTCDTFDMQVTIQKSKDKPGIVNVFELSINIKALGQAPAYSVVLDVTLPTGFTVETQDLESLLNGVDAFINHFYFEDKLSDRTSLIIHIYKVSNTLLQVVTFRLLQHFNVGFLQPSSVTVYEYYKETGQRCTQMYSPPQDQVQLTTICRNYVCQCAQDDCCEIKSELYNAQDKERETFACETLHHVFKVKVLNVSRDYYNKYELEITKVIKLGLESGVRNSERRFFFSHSGCRDKCQLQMNSEYLIIGPESDKWTTDTATDKTMYVLGKETWVERWPSETECKTPDFKAKCKSLTTATDYIYNKGCRAKK